MKEPLTGREPDFNNLLKVLRRQPTRRPALYELFLSDGYYTYFSGEDMAAQMDPISRLRVVITACRAAGYDYAPVGSWQANTLTFPTGEVQHLKSRSLNQGTVIADRASFEAYPWPDLKQYDYDLYARLAPCLPDGMKLIAMTPGGVLENVIALVGHDRLCYLVYDDEALVQDLFDAVGSRMVRHTELCAAYASVGALVSSDDWGFKTQTVLSPADMRRYVIPWHRRIVEAIHRAGKPAILHSCGNLAEVMDDIIDDLRFDAKHSYEDAILPVEEVYERWGRRIAILGGIDVDFLCTRSPAEVRQRSLAMLERSADRGGYALGSGNSIPDFVPRENFLAMLQAARDFA